MRTDDQNTIPPVTYLVECYWPGVTRAGVFAAIRRAHAAAADISRTGRRVELVRSTFVPGDEAVLCVFEASSPEDIAEANSRAGVRFDRISAAVDVAGEGQKTCSRGAGKRNGEP